jgi:hypothetical protein
MIQISLVESNESTGFTISSSVIDCDDMGEVQRFLDKNYKLGPKEKWILQTIVLHKTFDELAKYIKEII